MNKIKDDVYNLVTHKSFPDVLFIRADHWNEEAKDLYDSIKKNYKFIVGISSYQCFPANIVCPFENRPPKTDKDRFIINSNIELSAWCNCFRYPDKYIPNDIPKILFSESDLISIKPKNIAKKYDILCYIGNGNWNSWIRRIDVARRFLNYAASKGYKVCVCGSLEKRGFINCAIEPLLSQNDFLNLLESSKGLFVSNELDASPRIIVQSLQLGVPVMLNKNILGGWKYMTAENGMLFDPDGNTNQIDDFIKTSYKPNVICNKILDLKEILYSDWGIDLLLYINLDSRKDRKYRLLKMLKKWNIPENKIIRIPAVEDKICGHYGCCLSHLKALEYAEKHGGKKFMILEDDFEFILKEARVKHIVKMNNYDVLLLAKGHIKKEPSVGYGRAESSTTTSGYVVNSKYLPTLKKCFEKSKKALEEELKGKTERIYEVINAIDFVWFELQKKNNFIITNPPIGKQSFHQSSIMDIYRTKFTKPVVTSREEKAVALSNMREVLEDLEIHFWLDAGTLLGAYREKNFIQNDYDIDIAIFDRVILGRVDELKNALYEMGFTHWFDVIVNNELKGFQILHFNGTRIDFNFYFYNGHQHTYKVFYYDEPVIRTISGFQPVIFKGEKYDIPDNPEIYLVEEYGANWKIPIGQQH